MQPFTRSIERVVVIKTSVKGLPDTEWVLRLTSRGVSVRRRGESAETARSLTWRQIVGTALIHRSDS